VSKTLPRPSPLLGHPLPSTWFRTLCSVLAAGVLCVGIAKQAQAASTWTTIATEKQSFIVKNKTVRYGSGSTWITKKVEAEGVCTNAFFGSDPLPGVHKECQISKPSTTAESTPASYTLTIADPADGRIAGATSGATFASGTAVTLTAVGEGAYGLKTWTGDAASCGASNPCQITMAGNKTVGVTFKTMPVGFGAGTTGGAGGKVVTVSTAKDLKAALCDKFDAAGTCQDDTPRIIQLTSVIDFTGSEGKSSAWICAKSSNACKYQNTYQEKTIDYPVGTCHAADAKLADGSPDPFAKKQMDYDAAGGTPLRVGSNKTLIGIGAKAGLKGKGLMIAGVSNVIIRNLSLTDMDEWLVWGADAMTVVGASKVWIDHNYFARIGRQFIVTGWDFSTNLTISNNFFDGAADYGYFCNGKHYWTLLFNGANENITLIANRFTNVSGRAPETGNTGGTIHIVNNLWDANNYYISVGPSKSVVTFLEGNYFAPTTEFFIPINGQDANVNPVFAPLDGTIDVANVDCRDVLGRSCASNYATNTGAANSLSGFVLNPAVMSTLKSAPTLSRSMGLVRPMPYSKVTDHVKAKAGPQADPDQ